MALCRSGCMIVLCYLCRLLVVGWRLKGGMLNGDNLLRTARSATEAVPWHFGDGLCGFSPGLQTSPITLRRRSRPFAGYSAELFFLLLLVAIFIQPAAAANARHPSARPTEFPRPPAYQDAEEGDRGLLQDQNIAHELVPNPVVLNPPPEIYVTRAYRLLGFGHQPEFISCATTQAASAQRCLELLEPDVGVGRAGGQGALRFLQGPAVTDEL